MIVQISSDLEPLIPRYLENRKKDLEILTTALQSSDFEQIRSLGHTLKGSGTSFGLEEISRLGLALENAAKHSNTGEAERSISQMTTFLQELEIVFVEE